MMNKDLKIIKKKYGEKMMHLCRELFPTLLEKEGLLSELLLEHFEPSRFLYDDIISNRLDIDFEDYIYSLVNIEEIKEKKDYKTPEELLEEVGYDLYECQTEEEIQRFRKYYSKNEELCTFRGNRLKRCYVFFAVKKDVDNIRRENFQNPEREDLYGTSVISIQFTKDTNHTLSIKNRYNHTVNNPDATFGNNLDNIVEGLTESFSRYYGMTQAKIVSDFEIPGYVQAGNGKYYKYNYEIDNIYYCPNNIIIDNFKAIKLSQNKLLIDYFILDLENKTISLYDYSIQDCFPDSLKDILKIQITKENEYKKIIINTENGNITLKIDNKNKIIEYQNNNIKRIGNNFLWLNESLNYMELLNVVEVGDRFLYFNESLNHLNLPNVVKIGEYFLKRNSILTQLNLPNTVEIGDGFLTYNKLLIQLSLPNVIEINAYFLCNNESLNYLELPKVKQIGDNFLYYNASLTQLSLPNVVKIGNKFLCENKSLTQLSLPKAKKIGDSFLKFNESLTRLALPKAEKISDSFLKFNESLTQLSLPDVIEIGNYFLCENESLTQLSLPNVKKIGDSFLISNKPLTQLELPNVMEIGESFLEYNNSLIQLSLPEVKKIGGYFLFNNKSLTQLDLPNVIEVGINFLYYNTSLNHLELSNVKGRS